MGRKAALKLTGCLHKNFQPLQELGSPWFWCRACGAIKHAFHEWELPRGVSSNFADFINHASPEEKEGVYKEVIEKSTRRMNKT